MYSCNTNVAYIRSVEEHAIEELDITVAEGIDMVKTGRQGKSNVSCSEDSKCRKTHYTQDLLYQRKAYSG